MSVLYSYQELATEQIREGWKSHRRQVLALPTGAGKTFTFSYMAKLAAERGKTTLILTHRSELFLQTWSTFSRIGIDPYVINADGGDPGVYTGVFVVMVETLARRPELMAKIVPDLIVIDECHIGNFNKIIDMYPDSYVLGVTATPIGKHFEKYYTNLVQTIDTPDLIKQGFLMPYRAYQMADDFSDLKRGVGGDFSERSQFDHFNKSKLYDGVIEEWRKRSEGKPTIVFNCNIKHSDEMAERFRDAGIESYSITSKTPKKERDAILDRFHSGEFSVLNNAGILVAGYDYPPIECVILNKATDSLISFLQMIGRGSRKSPGKEGFVVLDFGGNHTRHGLWSQPREWSLDQKKRTKKGESVVKDCPKCEAMIHGSARICEYCGYEFPVATKSLRDGVMVEYFEKDIPRGKSLKDCTPEELALLVKVGEGDRRRIVGMLRRRGIGPLAAFGKEMGYSYGWAQQQMKFLKQK